LDVEVCVFVLREQRGLSTAGRKADLIARLMSVALDSLSAKIKPAKKGNTTKPAAAAAVAKTSQVMLAVCVSVCLSACPSVCVCAVFDMCDEISCKLSIRRRCMMLLIQVLLTSQGKDACSKGEKASGNVSRGAQAGGEMDEGVSMLLKAWRACHPAGPPLLIR